MSEDIFYSYNPRQWVTRWSPSVASPGKGGPAQQGRARAISIAGGLGILIAGGLIAWLGGPGEPTRAPDHAPGAPAPAQPNAVRRTLELAGVGELQGALERFGLPPALAAQVFAQAQPHLNPTGPIRAVLEMTRAEGSLRFRRLQASNQDSSGAIVRMTEQGQLATTPMAAQVSERTVVLHGTMDGDSFYTSAVAIGVPNAVISPFAKALSFDFDFQRDVAAGDAFELAYSQPTNAAGEAMGAPTLLYASLTTSTKSAAVYLFQKQGGEPDWYDAGGSTVTRSLMRTPVDGARITSKFGMRFHPVLHYTRLHGGVDFAAPIGTPIYAAANGTVTSATPNNCAGNMVVIQHANGMETRYFHLIHYAEGLHAGQQVPQGTTIGFVGVTGICTTGPHLHYEIHMNGERVDPQSVQPDTGSERKSLSGADLEAFERVRDRIDVVRAQSGS